MGDAVRRCPRAHCPVCGASGTLRHARLADRWFGVPGEWSMRACGSRACGTWYLDPMPHGDDLPRLYGRYYTHGSDGGLGDVLGRGTAREARLAFLARAYGYRPEPAPRTWLGLLLWLVPGRREHLELAMFALEAGERGPLLDVGCGNGLTVRLLRDLGWHAEGIDVDPRAVEVARRAGLEARVGTLDDASLPVAHFAAVTSNHVLEHVADPAAFLRGCLRVTRPGGRLALVTPNVASLGHRAFGARWRGLEPPRHLQIYSARALARLAREVGYRDVRVRTSARLAGMIARETLRPDTAGLATPQRAGWPVRIAAGAFQWVERALLAVAPGLGEELLLTGRAPGEPR